jgi:hypothetical protein
MDMKKSLANTKTLLYTNQMFLLLIQAITDLEMEKLTMSKMGILTFIA